jgi:hypothetical protein
MKSIYPAWRAVELAVRIPAVRPLRLFPVLWPLHRVEVSANIYDDPSYDLIDHFLVRAVHEAGITAVGDLCTFLALPSPVVRRCLAFLATIGHVRIDGEQVQLEELGVQSLQAGIRYEPKLSRLVLLFEKYTSQPLPRRYHEREVPILRTAEVPPNQTQDGSRFRRIFIADEDFRVEWLTALANRPDRAKFNLVGQFGAFDLGSARPGDGFLPAYLIETAEHGLLVYSAVAEERDSLLEDVCRDVGHAGHLISAEPVPDPRGLWLQWLAGEGLGSGDLTQQANGVWRVTLRPSMFGEKAKLPVSRIGRFWLYRNHFLQLWCDDPALRRQSVLERTVRIAGSDDAATSEQLLDRATWIAEGLQVDPPSMAEIRDHAVATGAVDRLARLDISS